MEITNTLNLAKAKALFEENAVLWERRDIIPKRRAVELFGDEAANFVTYNGSAQDRYLYSSREGIEIPFFTWTGFCKCVAYHNIRILQESRFVKPKIDD